MAGFGMSARLGAMSLIGIVALAGVGIDAVLAQSTSSEAALWSSVRNSGRAADLERYLKSYPAGEYAPLARLKLRVARKTENRESVRTETKARESEDAKKSPQKPKNRLNDRRKAPPQVRKLPPRTNSVPIVTKPRCASNNSCRSAAAKAASRSPSKSSSRKTRKNSPLIPTGINQNPCAHFRRPIDMIFHG